MQKNIVKSDNTEADNLFDSILSWHQEYKTAWEMYEDIVLDSLGFIKTADEVFRILSTEMGSSVAVAYLLPEDTDLNSTEKGKYSVDAIKAAKKNDVTWAIVSNGMEALSKDVLNISIILKLAKTVVSQLYNKIHIITVIYRKSWEITILSFITINKMILSN